MAKTPPNTIAYLIELTNVNHKEVVDRLEKVEAQVSLTNGRVTKLEQRVVKEDTITAYKKEQKLEQGAEQASNPKGMKFSEIDSKTIAFIIATLGSLIYALFQQVVHK